MPYVKTMFKPEIMDPDFLNKDIIKVSKHFYSTLLEQFPSALNIDWIKNGDFIEALFYVDSTEYIAKFEPTGELKNYKINLHKEFVPDIVRQAAIQFGEIMSAISINTGRLKEFEVIIRKLDQSRQLLFIDANGSVIESADI